ncbi:preprotein translocase subunit SecA [Feifania hominis]|uniref:Protein translocase subunit SecA n=1 Tax=Feifania hominis TaxID=2763660 RepID=A0A926HQS9_9FIRM|nr:preprotein translocase subunit SecA [Feifania hominis]
MLGLFDKLFGTYSERELKKIEPIVARVEALEQEYRGLSDAELKAKTPAFRQRLAGGETLDDLLPEAFAAVREASDRVIGLRHYHVQLIGGVVLHQGRIAEMRTGEGKTLVATLPAYLNALTGKGVHIVTVNDYLARRDSEWMGKIYRFLGLKVGLVVHGLTNAERREAYAADITYGTNNELGFDYLRDNMVIYKQDMVQRGHVFAIVDEVDSILIDEARTPLIISGQGDKSTDLYREADRFVRGLRLTKVLELDSKELAEEAEGDYVVDEKEKSATLTKEGIRKAEAFFKLENLSDPENTTIVHHINQALKAHGVMKRDVDYVVKEGQVIIVDEFTGRLMFGRRYNQGLHQAIEAKEKVNVQNESRTLATITFQNYFRLYGKLSGMTGTALTEENEFREIYSLDVVEIPTNKPMIRRDYPDVVYRTERGKFGAVIDQIVECHKKGQPVLVGTVSIEKSEHLSALLKKQGIPHEVLNAKYHEKEAQIIAQAGKRGAVTIATNMAGRGTDIILGGNAEYMAKDEMRRRGVEEALIAESTAFGETDNQEILDARALFSQLEAEYKKEVDVEAKDVIAAGGLFIVGTERHESRRVDNQLRGRAGRQGDPGESRFYLSLEDDLMRLFGSDRMAGLVDSLGMDENTPIEAKILSNTIESAQRRVEGRNFDTRKHVLRYDDVMNKQRETIYAERLRVLNGENLRESIVKMIRETIGKAVEEHTDDNNFTDDWDFDGLKAEFLGYFLTPDDMAFTKDEREDMTREKLRELLFERAMSVYEAKEQRYGELMRELERVVLLQVVDRHWMDHIDAMDELRRGVSLRGYGQQDPVIAYQNEGFDMFEQMTIDIREETVRLLFRAEIKSGDEPKRQQVAKATEENLGEDGKQKPVRREGAKVGRNDPCPCGSGLKYKKCCGK